MSRNDREDKLKAAIEREDRKRALAHVMDHTRRHSILIWADIQLERESTATLMTTTAMERVVAFLARFGRAVGL